ncbi:ald [Symbiodinium sp. KB8]|nr:ald [Symbiodinium sp. KB8]
MAIEAKADVVVDNLSNDEVLELLRGFGAEPLGEPVRLFGGYASSNFKVMAKVDGGESKAYLLKVNYYGLNLEDIEHQLFVMNHLRTSSFPTNYPYPSKSGTFYEVKGGRTAILLDFITGKRGDEMLASDEGKTEKLLKELAAALAQLHQVSWPSDKKLRDIRAGYPLCNTGDLLRGEPRTMASAAGIPTWENVYINGQRRWWSRPASPEKFCDVIDSNTGKVCARVPAGGAKDVEKAVAAAREAFPSWAEKPLDERKAILLKVLETWQGKKAKATEWLCKELGCTAAFAKTVQVNMVDFHLGTCLKLVDMVKFEERMAFGSLVVREPIGVVGCITPWNYPLNQIAAKVFPAMLVGCTIVLKPSEVTPVCAYLLAEAVHEAGVPAGVFNMLMGDGPNCGEAIAAHPGVDMVSFTGSTRAGKRISEVGAQTLKVVRTELGGKSAALLLEDADLPKLVPKFMQTLMNNSGQSCNALSRMLVPRSRYDEAVGIAKQVAEQTTVSFAQDDKCELFGKCPPIGAYAAAAAGIASPDDFRAFLDPFVGAMASSRVELAAALEVVRSAVADGDDLAPLFSVWSGLERQAITKAVANSAVTAGAMPSTAKPSAPPPSAVQAIPRPDARLRMIILDVESLIPSPVQWVPRAPYDVISWIRDHSALFVDDTHASFVTHNISNVNFAFKAIHVILEVYGAHGMKFNPSKSEVVLGMRGKGSKEFLHQHLPGSADKCCLVIGIGAIGNVSPPAAERDFGSSGPDSEMPPASTLGRTDREEDQDDPRHPDKFRRPDIALRNLPSVGAPGTVMRFDSTRKLVEQHQSAVTFFLGVSLRDPLSLACYRALQQLCFNTSTQLIKMRMKRVKMERQPLVQVLQDSLQALCSDVNPVTGDGFPQLPLKLPKSASADERRRNDAEYRRIANIRRTLVRRPTGNTWWRWSAAAHTRRRPCQQGWRRFPSPLWTKWKTWSTTSVRVLPASGFLPRPQRHTISSGGYPPMSGGDVCQNILQARLGARGGAPTPAPNPVARGSRLDASVLSFFDGETTPILVGMLTMSVPIATAPNAAEALWSAADLATFASVAGF